MTRCLIVLFLVSIPLFSAAEDSPVYESFSGVSIGRVFLSQGEREYLDSRRLDPPQPGSAAAASGVAVNSKPIASAGYIIGSNGVSKVWKDGDFVASSANAAKAMSFPGNVKITRHVSAAAADDAGEDAAAKDSEADSGDD